MLVSAGARWLLSRKSKVHDNDLLLHEQSSSFQPLGGRHAIAVHDNKGYMHLTFWGTAAVNVLDAAGSPQTWAVVIFPLHTSLRLVH